jgi:hypothetical protein
MKSKPGFAKFWVLAALVPAELPSRAGACQLKTTAEILHGSWPLSTVEQIASN